MTTFVVVFLAAIVGQAEEEPKQTDLPKLKLKVETPFGSREIELKEGTPVHLGDLINDLDISHLKNDALSKEDEALAKSKVRPLLKKAAEDLVGPFQEVSWSFHHYKNAIRIALVKVDYGQGIQASFAGVYEGYKLLGQTQPFVVRPFQFNRGFAKYLEFEKAADKRSTDSKEGLQQQHGAAVPDKKIPAVGKGDTFAVKCPINAIYLWAVDPSRWQGGPKSVPMRCDELIQITQNGKLPEQGIFNVNGRPVEPQLGLATGKKPQPKSTKGKPAPIASAQSVETRFNGKTFDVMFRVPGTHTLRARVGNWSDTVVFEVRQLPAWQDMPAKDLITRIGFPDKKERSQAGELWHYKKYPQVVFKISGDPGTVADYSVIRADPGKAGRLPE